MIQKAKKRTSFFLGILITSILGAIGGHINANYSKDGSFLVPVAKADIPATSADIFGGSALYVDAGSGGSGCDGGSGDGGSGGSGGDCG